MSSIFQTKFVALLRTFDQAELRDFRQWLVSPWCSSNKNLVPLFEELRKHHPRFTSPHLTKELLFERVLPNGKYSDRRLNNLMSEAFQQGLRFLTFRSFAENRHEQQLTRAAVLRRKHLDNWFFKHVDKETQELEQQDIVSWDDRLLLYRLRQATYHHPTQSPALQAGDPTIVRMGQELDLLYLLEKAVIIEEKRSRSNIYRDEDHRIEADVQRWLNASEEISHPAIQLYQMRFTAATPLQPAAYQALRDAFVERFPHLNEREQKLHLIYLLNDTMRLVKRGKLDVTATLPLYKMGLQAKLLLHEGQLTRNTFTSIVVASNTKGDFDFTHHFIEHYTQYVDATIAADCHRWGKAHTAYWSMNLEHCIALLNQREFDTPHFQFIARVLHTQAYFDLYLRDDSYEEYLLNYLRSYERWLSRNKNYSKGFKQSFLHFVNKCRQLAVQYASTPFEASEVEKLLDESANIQALNWLKRKQQEILEMRSAGN